jgi:hypothetical protein
MLAIGVVALVSGISRVMLPLRFSEPIQAAVDSIVVLSGIVMLYVTRFSLGRFFAKLLMAASALFSATDLAWHLSKAPILFQVVMPTEGCILLILMIIVGFSMYRE